MLQYEKIMNQLIWEIKANKYLVGSRLPGERELAIRFNTSQKTIHNAVLKLAGRGFIESRHGSGNYVVSLNPDGEKLEHISIIMNCSHNKSRDDFFMTQTFMDMIGSVNAYIRPRGVAAEFMIYQDDEPVMENSIAIPRGGYYLNLFFTATGELAKELTSHGGVMLSTVTTFHEKRFKAEYPGLPYVLCDYRTSLRKAFEFYKSLNIKNYAYFSQGAMGEKNYDIFSEIAAEYELTLSNCHFKVNNSREANIYSGKRVEFFRDVLQKLPDNTVIFSDGVFHIAELLHSFADEKKMSGNFTFCLTGMKNPDELCIESCFVDHIPFQSEKIAVFAAKSLLDCMNDKKELPLCQILEIDFIPDKRRNCPDTVCCISNSSGKGDSSFMLLLCTPESFP